MLTVFFVGCSSSKTEADSEDATYLESVDKYNTFNAIKLVDKETGCKYLVISADSAHRQTVTQMLDEDGYPLCK